MSTTAGETLVMTATFRADSTPVLVVRNEQERTLQYLCALVAWSRTARLRRIVLAENSNTQFDFSEVVAAFAQAGKTIEVLIFDGNAGAPRFGKGYGEGEIMKHVFEHSRLLCETPSFYKVTGRLFVRNFDALSEATPRADAFRLNPPREGHPPKAITSFFKCSRELFETRLLNAYTRVNDEEGHRIEQVYFDQLVDLNIRSFGMKPVMVGQQASTGKMYEPYDEDVIRAARALLRA